MQRKPQSVAESSSANEKHYAVKEIMVMWHMGRETVRQLFIKEPGVIFSGGRQRKTMWIPQSVLDRVHRRLQKTA